jgi:hypothetical protein
MREQRGAEVVAIEVIRMRTDAIRARYEKQLDGHLMEEPRSYAYGLFHNYITHEQELCKSKSGTYVNCKIK